MIYLVFLLFIIIVTFNNQREVDERLLRKLT